MTFPNTYASDGSLYILRNNVNSVLNGGMSVAALSMTLASSAEFPGVGYVTADTEAIHYTGNVTATGVLSGLTRGADSTTATVHIDNTPIYANFVANHHNVMKDEIILIEQNIVQKLGSGTASIVVPGSVSSTFNGSVTLNTTTTMNGVMTFNTTTTFNGPATHNTTTTFNGPVTFNSTTTFNTATAFKGVVDGSSGAAGYIGEYRYAEEQSVTSAPATGDYKDLTLLSLTAGDWDISIQGYATANGATWTGARVGIGANAGNSGADVISGINSSNGIWTSTANMVTTYPLYVVPYRWSLNAGSTAYLKIRATYSAGGPPQFVGRISARRMR